MRPWLEIIWAAICRSWSQSGAANQINISQDSGVQRERERMDGVVRNIQKAKIESLLAELTSVLSFKLNGKSPLSQTLWLVMMYSLSEAGPWCHALGSHSYDAWMFRGVNEVTNSTFNSVIRPHLHRGDVKKCSCVDNHELWEIQRIRQQQHTFCPILDYPRP